MMSSSKTLRLAGSLVVVLITLLSGSWMGSFSTHGERAAISAPATGGPGSSPPFELEENNFTDGSPKRDLNGFLLGPQWSAQKDDGVLPDPSDTNKCARPDFSDSTCVKKDKPVIDKAGLCTLLNCGVGTIAAGGSLVSRVPGHVNWKAATYMGKGCFNDFSFDFDYTLNLMTLRQAGLTSLNPPNDKGTGLIPLAMHTEFDALETIDNFVTSKWKELRTLVGERVADCAREPKICELIDDKRVIEIGLVGLDTGHSGYSELHPVYALAIETTVSANESTWLLFARNRGDEGDCSRRDHPLTCNSSTQVNSVSLFIPAPLGKRVSGARLLADSELASNYGSSPNCPVFSLWHSGNDDGIAVNLSLPPGTYPEPHDGPIVEGVLHILWDVQGSTGSSDWDDFKTMPKCNDQTLRVTEETLAELAPSANIAAKPLKPIGTPVFLTMMSCPLIVDTHPVAQQPACKASATNKKNDHIEEFHKSLGQQLKR